MSIAEEFVAREVKSTARGKIIGSIFFLLLFVFTLCASIIGFFDEFDPLIFIVFVLLFLFSAVMIYALIRNLKTNIKIIKNPLEADTIKAILQSGLQCEDIYNTVCAPQRKILGICIGDKCLVQETNILNAFLFENVVKIYMSVHRTNGVEDKYAIAVVDKSGATITEWETPEPFGRKEMKDNFAQLIYELYSYCPNAKLGNE